MENGKLKGLKIYQVEAKMKGKKSEIGLPEISTSDDIFCKACKNV